MFGSRYGGFRYDKYRNGYEVWFRNKDDMLTLKLLSAKKINLENNYEMAKTNIWCKIRG